jgi:hypothetical protein
MDSLTTGEAGRLARSSRKPSRSCLDDGRPLRPDDRCLFIEELAGKLAGLGPIGDGSLHLTIREIQRQYFGPPPDAAA